MLFCPQEKKDNEVYEESVPGRKGSPLIKIKKNERDKVLPLRVCNTFPWSGWFETCLEPVPIDMVILYKDLNSVLIISCFREILESNLDYNAN